jgi:hypothetical protein
MAVLMAKPAATMETVNDLHGDLVNLARVIAHETYAEIGAILGCAPVLPDILAAVKARKARTRRAA